MEPVPTQQILHNLKRDQKQPIITACFFHVFWTFVWASTRGKGLTITIFF